MKTIINKLWFLGFLWVSVFWGCEDQGDSIKQGINEDKENGTIQRPDVDPSKMGIFDHGQITANLIDEDRETPPNGDFPGDDHRTLVTEIWYPEDKGNIDSNNIVLDRSGCPYPLIIFCHGYMAIRTQSTFYTEHLASYGYIIASPDFPLSNFSAPGGPTPADILNQPGDISFIIDEFLSFSKEEENPFYNCIDDTAIGVTGHSLGGLTTLLVTFHPDLADHRLKASAPLSPFACPFEEDFFANRDVPIFFIGGGNDIFVNFEDHLEGPYERAHPPKYLMEVIGGTHVGFTDLYIPETESYDFLKSFVSTEMDLTDDLFDIFFQMGDMERCGYTKEGMMPEVDVEQLGETVEPDIQREMLKIYATAFFNIYLKGDPSFAYFFTEDFTKSTPDARIRHIP